MVQRLVGASEKFMNIALIFAGGTGQRMNSKSKPKQFIELHGCPIIVYTLKHFQDHKSIDEIIVVCLDEWIEHLNSLVEQHGLNKVVAVIPGGKNGQESIFRGLSKAKEMYNDDSVVLIHDGVRPLISEDVITNNIESVIKHGSAVTVADTIETIVLKGDNNKISSVTDRKICKTAKAPQSFMLYDIYQAHLKAQSENELNMIDSASLMEWYGKELYMVGGPITNIKITTALDFYLFRAILDAKEDSQIYGFDN